MLNNLTNFFNLIRGRKIKTTPDGSDLIPLGTRDPRFDGSYQPTAITVDDFVASLPPDTNIYNSDGTLAGNRTVTMSSNTLNFSGGNIGINQPTPTVPLHIKGTAIPSVNEPLVRLEVADAIGAYLQMSNATLSNGEFVGEVVGRQNSSSNQSAVAFGGYIDATQDVGTNPVTVFRSALASLTQIATRPLFAFRNWSTTVMTILADGKVGIGTTTPTAKLEVNGPAFPGIESVAKFTVSDDASSSLQIKNGTNAASTFVPEISGTNSTDRTALGISGIATTDTGTESVTVFQSYLASLAAVVTRPIFQWKNFSTNVMTILANGNVGIGTTTPTEKLEVNGKTKTTTFQMTTTPTAGYVLTSDASGNGSWQLGGSASGKFGIADSTGAYTFYTTLSAAITAASSGQTVEFFTDYTETGNVTINLKDGVNINGNGHTYTCTYSAGYIAIFVNNTGTQTVSNLTIVGTGMNSTSQGFVISYTAKITYFNGVVIKMDAGYGGYVYGVAIIDGLICSVTGNARGFYVDSGSINNCKSFSTNNYAVQGINGAQISHTYAKSISQSAFYLNSSSAFNSTGIGSIGIESQGGSAYNCIGFSSSGYGIYVQPAGGTKIISNCTAISTASWGMFMYGNDSVINNNTIISTAANGIYSQFVSGCKISNNYITSSTAIAVRFNATSASFNNNHIDCTWNNAGGHAFQAGQSGDVLCGNVFQVANASANGLNAGSAVTTKYVDSKFIGATTSVNANITQGMVNTEDAYGNIII